MELENALSIERAHRAAAEQVALAHEQRAKTAEVALRRLQAAPQEQRPATAEQVSVTATTDVTPAKKEEPARWWKRRR